MPSVGPIIVSIAKSMVLLSGAVTALCLAMVVGWQIAICSKFTCTLVSVAQVLELAGIDLPSSYFTASTGSRKSRVEWPVFLEPLLEAPAIAPLCFALAFLVLFYLGLRLLETAPERR